MALGAYRKYFIINEGDFSNSLLNLDDPASSDDTYKLESWLTRAEYTYNHTYNLSLSCRERGQLSC